jgi:hypothetical protein
VAEALAAGLRGRAARGEREREEFTENEERQRELSRRQALSDALQGFDPNNPQAVLPGLSQGAPEEAFELAQALLGQEAPERWTDPYDMGGVQVQRNERNNQVRPVITPNSTTLYQPPSGYRGSPDSLEPIPGGPADVRATAEGRARVQQMESSARQLENAIAVLDQAIPQVDWNSTGLVGQVTRGVGGTDAFNLDQLLEPVRATLSFENLAEMRRNSTTGGALGSIAVRELELLAQTVRSLNTAQGTPQMRRALQETRAQLARTLQALQAARQEMDGGPGAEQAPANDGSAPDQPRVRVWNRQTGRFD